MSNAQKRQDRRRRENDLIRTSLDQGISAANAEIVMLTRELNELEAVKKAVLPGILKTLEDFYQGATFAARNQFDGDINRIEARIVRLRNQIAANQNLLDNFGADQ